METKNFNNNNKYNNENKNKNNYYEDSVSVSKENNSEKYIYDYDGILQKLIKEKNKGKNRINEYYCNLLINCCDITSLGKIELIKLLYAFNSNKKDKNYTYFLFQKLTNILENLNEDEILELDLSELIEILLEKGKFFKEEGNNFYSYYYLFNNLYRDIPNIKNLRHNIKEEMFKENEKNKEKFLKKDNQKYEEIFIKLNKIINRNQKLNSNDYLYVLNNLWLKRALDFISCILNSKEYERKKTINLSFSLYEIYNRYFNVVSAPNICPYPGKIDNFILGDFKDIWKDPLKEEENFVIKQNIFFEKDYCLVDKKDWEFFKELFGSTNEIKKKINNLDLIKIKAIILDKRIVKKKFFNLLKPKYIQTKIKININEFKKKIIRCVNFTLKNIEFEINNEEDINENIDEINTGDEDINATNLINERINNYNTDYNDEFTNNINIYQNKSIDEDNLLKQEVSFYKLNQTNKELLIEILTGFVNEFPKYESIYINKILLKDEDFLQLLFDYYNESEEILIIEIFDKNSKSYLSQKEKNGKNLYQCSICHKWEPISNKYNCPKCHLSFYCSKKCSDSLLNNEHFQFHEYLKELQIKNNNISNKYNNNNIVGLLNLGNTCFINSTLQCLFNTYDLSQYFLQNIYKKEINIQNKQGYKGEIAEAFANLLFKVKTSTIQRINPIDFLKIFFNKNKSLNLRNQQDAQEFLSILLDCLHEDLNRITKKPYVLLEEQKDTESDSEASRRFWNLYKKRENSIIVDLFHGQFKSKITCSTCNRSSITYDPFIFLGLPIPQQLNQEIIKFYFGNRWNCFGFEMNEKSTILDLKKKGVEFMNMTGYCTNKSLYDLYNIIELVLFDKNKIIKNIYNESNQITDEELLYNLLNKDKSLEIVLYEKKLDKDYFNVYFYPIIGDTYDSSSYPISISSNKEMTLSKIIEENRLKIYKLYSNINDNENIKIGLLHKKNNGWIYFLRNKFDSNEYCPICNNKEENFCEINKNVKIGIILNKLKRYNPILFVIGCNKKKLLKYQQIPEKLNNGLFSLDDCLKLFCEEELLNSDNMWYCTKCGKHRAAKKQIRLFKLPRYLIIQLKKFQNSSGFLYSSNDKKDSFIKYPLNNLDLSNFIENNEDINKKYELYAVIQHHGEINQGHYTAICKINDMWVLYNDSILSKINNPITNDAYLLFYRMNEKN